MSVVTKFVLILVHEHDRRVKLRQVYETLGHFVVSAASGIDALGLIEKVSTPSLILLGSDLPMMSAEEFIKILGKDQRYSAIPIIKVPSSEVAYKEFLSSEVHIDFSITETC